MAPSNTSGFYDGFRGAMLFIELDGINMDIKF